MSWSGDKSRTFAGELKPWLEQVLPGTDVWLSSEDIDKGIRSLESGKGAVLDIEEFLDRQHARNGQS